VGHAYLPGIDEEEWHFRGLPDRAHIAGIEKFRAIG